MLASAAMVNIKSMPVCKLVFDDDDECDLNNKSMEFDVAMEMCNSAFGPSRRLARHHRIFSPRKPVRPKDDSPTTSGGSFKGYTISPTNSISPPDKKVRSLRLFDSPNTPKTLLHNATQSSTPADQPKPKPTSVSKPYTRSRLFGCGRLTRPSASAHADDPLSDGMDDTSDRDSSVSSGSGRLAKERASSDRKMGANVNPFTPTNILLSSRKRARKSRRLNQSREDALDRNFVPLSATDKSSNNSSFQESMDEDTHPLNNNSTTKNHNTPPLPADDSDEFDEDEDGQPSKRVAIHEVNVSRYHKEFLELSVIGRGVFGSVYLVRHRLDGCLYAIKRSLKPVAGSASERTALNEVYAHAVLGAHQHVVRYYSAWAEDDHMIIQNEYCNGGSLARMLDSYRRAGRRCTEEQIKTILLHLAKGLKFIHSLHMVHLDVKPDNIFITCERSKHNAPNEDSADDGFEEDPSEDAHTDYTYKIGDLGHVTSVMNPKVEEGDCRYLPRELLQDDYSALPKVDIFALGLTLYEAASGCSLPLNGPEWQAIRNGDLPEIPGFSKCFQDLLRLMIHDDPKMRPSACELINHEVFNVPSTNGSACKSRGQLRRELEAARRKNLTLEKELEQAKYFLQHLSPSTPPCFAVHGRDSAGESYMEGRSSPACDSPVPSLMEAESAGSPMGSHPTLNGEDGKLAQPPQLNSNISGQMFQQSQSNGGTAQMFQQSQSNGGTAQMFQPPQSNHNSNGEQLTQSSHTERGSKFIEPSSRLLPNPSGTALGSHSPLKNPEHLMKSSIHPSQPPRPYHYYNTRSQQNVPSESDCFSKSKHVPSHGKLVGKRANRSQSVV